VSYCLVPHRTDPENLILLFKTRFFNNKFTIFPEILISFNEGCLMRKPIKTYYFSLRIILISFLITFFLCSFGKGEQSQSLNNQVFKPVQQGQYSETEKSDDEPPFGGAEPLVTDQEFYRSIMIANAKKAGISTEIANVISERSFTTSATFDEVFNYIVQHIPSDHADHMTLRDTDINPDPGVRPLLESLDESELSAIAKRVNSDLSGTSYRKAFLAAYDEGKPKEVMRGIIAHKGEDGTSMVIYELYRPYFDFGLLRWIDATRIRVIKQPML
jgi:hypothetical protein